MKALLTLLALLLSFDANALVKLTNTNKCHEQTSPYYNRIVHYTPYDSLADCAIAVGYDTVEACSAAGDCYYKEAGDGYDRSDFLSEWADPDGNGHNTRFDLLVTRAISLTKIDGTVVAGKWYSYYDNKVVEHPLDLDVDHIVPLKWAYDHGASEWQPVTKHAFANDMDNLVLVSLSENRQKGDKGFTEWLPEYSACRYIYTFNRIVIKYRLTYTDSEKSAYDDLYEQTCK